MSSSPVKAGVPILYIMPIRLILVPLPPVSNGFYMDISNQHRVPFTDFQIRHQKLGDILENKVFQNLKLSKNSNIKQHFPTFSLNEKK